MKKKVFTEEDRELAAGPYRDNPEGVATDKVTLFDMHEDMKTVDTVSMEDLNKQVLNDPYRNETKNPSASESHHPNSDKKRIEF